MAQLAGAASAPGEHATIGGQRQAMKAAGSDRDHVRQAGDGHRRQAPRACVVAELTLVVQPPRDERPVAAKREAVIAAGSDGNDVDGSGQHDRRKPGRCRRIPHLAVAVGAPREDAAVGAPREAVGATSGDCGEDPHGTGDGDRREPGRRGAITQDSAQIAAPAPESLRWHRWRGSEWHPQK